MPNDARHPASGKRRGEVSRRSFLIRAGQTALGVAAMPILAACAPSGGGNGGATRSPAGGTIIEMTDDLRFVPDQITVKVGDTVTWRNTGSIVHTATDDPAKAQDATNAVLPDGAEPWDSGNLAGGEEWSYTFATRGDYTYFCIPHELAGMVAQLTVTE